jgi:AcrR family transcriptional regulator
MGPTRMLLSKPVIAAVSGYCVAGGLELACWCDLRVAEESATFGVFCRRFGVPLIDGGTLRLPRLIGASRAMDLILTGRPVGAEEALAMGLANRVVADGAAREAAEALAAELARHPQACLRHDRLSSIEQWSLPLPQALANEFTHGQATLESGRVAAEAPHDSPRGKESMARSEKKPAPRKAAAADEGNRRAELIRAAGRLFVDKGFDATTIRDIADAVGMRSGSPFYHFKSKQDMLKSVMIEGLQAALDAQQAAVAGLKDPEEKFRALVKSHLRIILEDHTEFPVLLYEWRALSDESRAEVIAVKDRYEAVWQPVLRDLKKAGRLGDDSKVARLMLFGALNWTVQWYRPGGGLTLDQIAERAIDFFLCDKTGKPK